MHKLASLVILPALTASCALLIDPMAAPADGLKLYVVASQCDDLTAAPVQQEGRDYFTITRRSGGTSCEVTCAVDKGPVGSEYRVMWCERVAEARAKEQKEAAEQAKWKAQEEARAASQAEADSREAAAAMRLEAAGYKHLTIADFRLDEKTMPVGKKIFIKGYYESRQGWQHLTNCPQELNCGEMRYAIPINTDSAPRDTRKALQDLERHNRCSTGLGACALTLIGKVDRCTYTEWGVQKVAPCIFMDDFSPI